MFLYSFEVPMVFFFGLGIPLLALLSFPNPLSAPESVIFLVWGWESFRILLKTALFHANWSEDRIFHIYARGVDYRVRDCTRSLELFMARGSHAPGSCGESSEDAK